MNTIADPLFVRAEVQYRMETWGAAQHRRAGAWPDVAARLRRRLAAGPARTARSTRPASGAATLRRPRHP